MQNAGDARVFFAPFRGIGQGKRRLKPFPLMCRSQRYRFRWSGFCDAVQGGGRPPDACAASAGDALVLSGKCFCPQGGCLVSEQK